MPPLETWVWQIKPQVCPGSIAPFMFFDFWRTGVYWVTDWGWPHLFLLASCSLGHPMKYYMAVLCPITITQYQPRSDRGEKGGAGWNKACGGAKVERDTFIAVVPRSQRKKRQQHRMEVGHMVYHLEISRHDLVITRLVVSSDGLYHFAVISA